MRLWVNWKDYNYTFKEPKSSVLWQRCSCYSLQSLWICQWH